MENIGREVMGGKVVEIRRREVRKSGRRGIVVGVEK